MRARPGLLGAAWTVARKDLLVELRTRTTIISVAVFSLLAITIFFFAWDPTAIPVADLAPGVLWVIFIFSGLLGLHRSFALEQETRAIDALLASPASRHSIFLGKAAANFLFVFAVQLVSLPSVALLYNLEPTAALLSVLAISALACVGLAAVGTLFGAMTANTKLTELLLPVLTLPFFVPVLVPAAQASAKALAGRPLVEIAAWLKILLAFDLVFVFACAAIYPYTLEE